MSWYPPDKDPLDLHRLRAALTGTRFAAQLHHFSSVGSTNTLLLEAAANGAPEGTVYVADEQTAGRGRSDHAWHSAADVGLYFSVLVKPLLPLREVLLLSLATGLAAWQAVSETAALDLDLRWPNDLLIGGRKLGGILVETASEPGDQALLRYAVIGIGINLHQRAFPPELAALATSLDLQSNGTSTDRTTLAIALLRALDLELTHLESASGDPAPLRSRFAEHSTWVRGKRVHVPEQQGYTGTTAGLDSRGFLLVDADDGSRRTVLSGGVRESAT
jgi:BirA family biotin operon repressor/biotin-[acetyl-CoA-carboxylase] ligase